MDRLSFFGRMGVGALALALRTPIPGESPQAVEAEVAAVEKPLKPYPLSASPPPPGYGHYWTKESLDEYHAKLSDYERRQLVSIRFP